MEKSRKKFKGVKIYYIVLILAIIFVVSMVAGKILFNNKIQVEHNSENQIENVVDNEEKEDVQVPKVVGKSFEEAKKELEKVNLKAEKIEEKNEYIANGYVIRQEPTSNTTVEEGTTVKLYVSIEE